MAHMIQLYKSFNKDLLKDDDEAEVDGKRNKNAGNQLDGVLRDCMTFWQYVKCKNALSNKEIWMNSNGTTFGNSLTKE